MSLPRHRHHHRPIGAALALAMLALVAGACGGSSDDSDEGAGGDGPAVEVEHRFGVTEIDGVPQRIVSLSSQWTDVLLAMGTQPIAHGLDPNAGDNGLYPWQTDIGAESEGIELAGTKLPMEQIAALHPDLILVSWLAEDEAVYDELTGIAPTIGLLGDGQVDSWQDMAEVAGRFLDDPEAADAVVEDVAQLMADTAAELPGLAGKSFSMANYVPGDQLYVVADPEDGSSVFFQDLGLTLDPEILAEADGALGRIELSFEQAGMLDSDLLVIFSNGADPHSLVGYDRLPAVQAGSVAELGYAAVAGLNTPSPLSIPYSLELVLPALRTAAGMTSPDS